MSLARNASPSAEPEDDRAAAVLRDHDHVGGRGGDHGERVGADQLGRGLAHGRQQVAAGVDAALDQVRHQLGVGLGPDLAAFASRRPRSSR